jgi:hypothetical protein
MRFTPVLALFALALSLPAYAGGNGAYLLDKDGHVIKSGQGLCVRTSRWTEQNADQACIAAAKKSSIIASKR